MSFALDVKPELQDRVIEEARRLNLDPILLLSEVIRKGLTNIVSERSSQSDNSAHVAEIYQDPLTSLPNHGTFYMQLTRQWQESSKTGAAFTLLLLDLDNFKRLNDSLGHMVGDQLLKEIAATLVHQTRAQDFVARLGGDEFAIILPGIDAAGTTSLVSIFHGVLRDFFSDKGQPVTASIGIAEAPPYSGSANDLLNRVYQALSREKEEKREERNKVTALTLHEDDVEQSKAQRERAQRNARLVARLRSFSEGDPERQQRDLAALQAGLEEARPGQRRLFGEGVNP